MTAPRFSIIMPALDVEEYVGDAISSVRAQTRGDWELIVVDDGSQDATFSVAAEAAAADPRVNALRHEGERRQQGARITAARHATAPWLVRLDADDLMEPGYLEHMARFMDEHPGHDIYSCNGWIVGQDGNAGAPGVRPCLEGRAWRRVRSTTFEELLERNTIFTMAVISRGAYERTGGCRPGVYLDDYDLWLRAMAGGATHMYNPEILGRYRRRSGQMSADLVKVYEGGLEVMEHLRGDPGLTERQRGIVDSRSAQLRAMWRMASGDFSRARRDHWRCRGEYRSRARFLLSYPLMLASPRHFWRLYVWRRTGGRYRAGAR